MTGIPQRLTVVVAARNESESLPALLDLVERWIRQHRVPGTTPVRELKS